jgi:predicted Rossmann-fold nucleotide-binding protein
MSVGISPASSKVEHVMKYRLPTESYDTILYTGLHYVGRDTLLITSSDAVVSIGGRLGTLHEFTIAMETDTPIGFLQGAGGISEEIQTLMSLAHPLRSNAKVTFNEDSDALIRELTDFLDAEHVKYHNLY